jgi:hypothetical protein
MTWQMLSSPRGVTKIIAITTTATLTCSPSIMLNSRRGSRGLDFAASKGAVSSHGSITRAHIRGLLRRLIHLLVADQVSRRYRL